MTGYWLTEVERLALTSAAERECVMINGAFCGKADANVYAVRNREFYSRRIVCQLVARKLLTLGRGFNEYVATDLGRAVVAMPDLPRRKPKVIKPKLRRVQLDMFRQGSAARG